MNRLEHKKLYDLVYIKYNQQLAQRYKIRDEIDSIILNDIDEYNEWLVGQVDDDNEEGEMSWFLMMILLWIGQPSMNLQVLENQ